jgi:WD40 repeat protein
MRLSSPGNSITYLSFDAKGQKLFSVSGSIREGFGQGGIRIWDLTTGTLTGTAALGERVQTADWSPDNRWICFGAAGRTTLLDALTMKPIWQFVERDPLVWSIRFSPDGKLIASAAADGRIKLLETATGKLTRSLGPHIGPVRYAAFSPDGKLLAAAGNTPEVRFWDVESGEIVRTIRGPTSIIETLAFAPSGKLLATGDHSGVIKVWDAATDQRGCLYDAGIYSAGSELRFSTGGEELFDVFGTRWRVDAIKVATGTGQARQLLPRDDKQHYYVTAISPDGQWLAGVDNSRPDDLLLWNTVTRQMRHLTGPAGQVSALRFGPDASWFAVSYLQVRDGRAPSETGAGGYGYSVVIWDVASGKAILSLDAGEREYSKMPRVENGSCLALSPDGTLVAHAGYYQPIRIWNRLTRELIKEIPLDDSWCRSLVFSGDNRLLAGQYVNNSLRVWNGEDWTERCQMKLAANECALALAPDGSRLASSDMWGKIQLWETETGTPVFELRGLGPAFGTMGIRAQVAFDDTGLRLASFNNNDTTNIFDATPQPVVEVGP